MSEKDFYCDSRGSKSNQPCRPFYPLPSFNHLKNTAHVFVTNEFSDEELEFLEEEHILIQDSDSKWSWLTSELAEKYFVSVLLPYYIIKPKLHREDLYLLGFRPFFSKLSNQKEIHFSVIKGKYLNLDAERLIEYLNEKFGVDKAKRKLENAKNRLSSITDTIPQSTIAQNRLKIKLLSDLGFSPIKCKECNTGVDLLVALQLHHPTESKDIILQDLYSSPNEEEYKIILEKFKSDKVELLCSNHHLEKQVFYPITFGDIIFKGDLFSMPAEGIDVYIDDYLSSFSKTERYREILYKKYTSNNLDIPSDLHIKWKYQIKRWIKKRFAFNELFDGKCVACGDSNLLHLDLHHIIPELKDLIENWQSISKLDCDEIMRQIIKEKCVSLCSNCHILITSKYHISMREVLKGFFTQQEIDKISEEVILKYNASIEKISNFSYDLENINFKDPLKLEFSQDDIWKIHLMTTYYYLKIKERDFFLKNEILYDLGLLDSFISHSIERLIDMGFVQKSDSSINYSLTREGLNKSLNLIHEHSKKANKIEEQIKAHLYNKKRFEFLDYAYSNKDKCFVKRKTISKEESVFKYCVIINDLITKKGINEFTTKELIPLIDDRSRKREKVLTIDENKRSESSNWRAIAREFQSRLIPLNLVEEVENPISYSLTNSSNLKPKVYRLTKKGVNIVKKGFEKSLNSYFISPIYF